MLKPEDIKIDRGLVKKAEGIVTVILDEWRQFWPELDTAYNKMSKARQRAMRDSWINQIYRRIKYEADDGSLHEKEEYQHIEILDLPEPRTETYFYKHIY